MSTKMTKHADDAEVLSHFQRETTPLASAQPKRVYRRTEYTEQWDYTPAAEYRADAADVADTTAYCGDPVSWVERTRATGRFALCFIGLMFLFITAVGALSPHRGENVKRAGCVDLPSAQSRAIGRARSFEGQ